VTPIWTLCLVLGFSSEPPSGWTSPDALGFAPARTGPYPRAYVFYSLINVYLKNFTEQTKSAFGIILGHTIVHVFTSMKEFPAC
jgi:hypothetical protein